MFSCALFHAGSDTAPVSAESSEIAAQVIGLVGQGKATCTYRLTKDRRGLLFYVPSTLLLCAATRQRVRLSRCQLSVTRVPGGETVTHSLHLTKIDMALSAGATPAPLSPPMPDNLELRRRYKAAVTKLCGAHSCEDVLLHVGDLPRGSELTVRFEFLTQLSTSSPSECRRVHYPIEKLLPSVYVSYNIVLAALSPVREVTASGSDLSSQAFSWSYLDSEEQHSNLVYVTCRTPQQPSQRWDWDAGHSSGFTVHLDSMVIAGCYSSNLTSSSGSASEDSPLAPYDGVMMISSVFGRHQLPASVNPMQFSPSEFIFVIDCSGSMSGTNIQIAADTLITCIKSLPTGSHFNVTAFGSTFRQLFQDSRECTQQSVETAVQFANQLQASLGGTELLRPLQSIFKTQRCSGLPCQVFIITDGGVSNTSTVLRCVRKNSHQARFHTFGIGPDVCVELVSGIAMVTGGQCVLLCEGERLQTKVMDVLKESMQPSLTNTILQWHPPRGYTVVDSSPHNLGTLFSGSSYSAFALLQKAEQTVNGVCDDEDESSSASGFATITGMVNGEQVNVKIDPVPLPTMTTPQSRDMASLLLHSTMLSKLGDLEIQALSSSRKNSQNDAEEHSDEPPAKRSRLNGTNSSHYAAPSPILSTQKHLCNLMVRDELAELSISSSILCGLTYFRADNGCIVQIVPFSTCLLSKSNSKSYHNHQNGSNIHFHRKRKRTSEITPAVSFSSLAKNTISCIGSTLKAVANITTFGLIGQESPFIENGQRIEDEVEYLEHRHVRLHWDESRGNIVYPKIYYRSHPRNLCRETPSEQPKRRARHAQHKKAILSVQHPNGATNSIPCNGAVISTTPNGAHLSPPLNHRMVLTTELTEGGSYSAGEEDEEGFTISDTESDSSVDPDWEDLRKPNELLPLIHMQLFSGAWPMVRAFSYAVGVPLEEIRKLPLCSCDAKEEETRSNSRDQHRQGSGQERKPHFWATALALACLEQHFAELKTEWEVVAYKGLCWLEQEKHHTQLSMSEVQRIAQELVQRQS